MTRAAAVRIVLSLLVFGACGRGDERHLEPEPISLESPFRYPLELWDERVEGQTIVMVHVTEVGAVDSAYVLETSGLAPFDSAALAGARKLRFAPARRGDRSVAMWARLPVRFRLPDSAAADAVAPSSGARP